MAFKQMVSSCVGALEESLHLCLLRKLWSCKYVHWGRAGSLQSVCRLSLNSTTTACTQCEAKSGEPLLVVGIPLFCEPGLNSGLSAMLAKGPGIEAEG